MKLVIDTNVYSDYAEGVPETVDFLATQGEKIFLPSIVIGELNFGFMKGKRQKFNEKKLKQFIDLLHVDVIDVNADVARKYATIYLSLLKKGTKIPITIYAHNEGSSSPNTAALKIEGGCTPALQHWRLKAGQSATIWVSRSK